MKLLSYKFIEDNLLYESVENARKILAQHYPDAILLEDDDGVITIIDGDGVEFTIRKQQASF